MSISIHSVERVSEASCCSCFIDLCHSSDSDCSFCRTRYHESISGESPGSLGFDTEAVAWE